MTMFDGLTDLRGHRFGPQPRIAAELGDGE
jgi:hypothetical protein